jgi:uncharacterized protein YdbL (DUF1318 family)
MNTSAFLRLFVLCFAFLGATAAVHAEDLGAIRGRMEKRIPQIDTLKTNGTLGENNRGLLEVRAASGDASAVASAENADRNAVYAAIAAKTGATADNVGKARAKQIAANSAAGVWLQRENGEWYKK